MGLRPWFARQPVLICGVLAAAVSSGCKDDLTDVPELDEASLRAQAVSPAGYVLVGAGNIARCDASGDEATARLLDAIPGTVFTTGNSVYGNGSSSEFSNCYSGNWGRHKARTRPAAGNSEYMTTGATPYYNYFGASAGEPGKGYYSYNLGDWHVVVLNSKLSTSATSAQVTWLKADLAANNRLCTLAYWQHPRFSSYGVAVRAVVKPLWDALYQAGAEVVINGHYEFYERFGKQDPNGKADPAHGLRQFTVGTGGQGTDPFGTTLSPNSQVRRTGTYGVLKLTLHSGSYAWEFVPVAGQTFTERNSTSCHGAPGAAVASVTVAPASATVEVGSTTQLTATVTDALGNTLQNPTMSWVSRDTLIARVTAAGLVTGIAAGTVAITVSSGDRSSTAAVTVTATSGSGGGTGSVIHRGYYASPGGSSSADGSYTRPWTLATALGGGNGRVQPGDTVWLRGGTYRGAFTSTLTGRSGAPIVVRQYPGERAIIDGAGNSGSTFRVHGAYSTFWGFEVTYSDPQRSFPADTRHARPNIVVNNANHTRFINLVIHDGGVAFYNYASAYDVEIVGCIIYNNGWQGSDRGHGHALYLKSDVGPVIARDNVMFNQYGYGVHVYTSAGDGNLTNIRLEGNVAFNNGTLSTNSTSSNVLIGGEVAARSIVLRDNMTYFSPGVSGSNMKIGYSTIRNSDVVFERNYAVGGSTVLETRYWSSARVASNTLVGPSRVVDVVSSGGQQWSSNMHHRDPNTSSWRHSSTSYTFSGWRSATGLGSTDQGASSTPSGTRVVVRRNPYEAGRANITVYNWARQGSVSADLSGILAVGDRYTVYNVQDLSRPVSSGTYGGGSISVPLSSVTATRAIGGTSTAPSTGVEFNTFIVTKS